MIQLMIAQILGVLLLYSLADAAPALVVGAVMNSDVVAQMESQFPKNVTVSLIKIEQVATYRCMNCYDFKLTYSGVKTGSSRPMKFGKLVRTKGLGATQVEVSLIHP